jgi:hypothetical protein
MKTREKQPISISSTEEEIGKTSPLALVALSVASVIIGAIGWAQGALTSQQLEPWDTGIGAVINQTLFCLTSFIIGSRTGFWKMVLSILCMYGGQLLYIWYFGTDDQRSWFMLCMMTTIILFVLPLLFGIAGSLHRFNRLHHITLIKRKARSP